MMFRLKLLGLCMIASAAVLFACPAWAHDATLLFEDTFDDMSHLSVGSLDSGVANFSIVASPGEKEGSSLQCSYDGVGGPGWNHRKHNLGGTALPTSGLVTFSWSFMFSNAIDEMRMSFCSDPSSHGPQSLAIVGSRGAPDGNLGLWSNNDWVIPYASGDSWGPAEFDEWHTVACVIDIDNTDPMQNVDVYLAQGLTVTMDDYWATCGWDLAFFPYNVWQFYEYGYPATGAWDTYVDDLAMYSGLAVEESARIPGDANEDGYVDVSDLGILATHYDAGDGKTWAEADFTGDGIVDVSDLGILATNYGTVPPQAVPEPSVLTGLLALCLTGILMTTRRK